MQSLQRGAVDPEEHDKQMKQSNFTLLKKAGLLTLLYILLTLGCVHRGAAYLMESGFIRKSVFSLIFFVIAFIIIRFM
jgi:hypothetical protein